MTMLRQRMIEDMQLRGLAPRTQEAYVAAVAQLAKYYHKPPDEIGEEELRLLQNGYRVHLALLLSGGGWFLLPEALPPP